MTSPLQLFTPPTVTLPSARGWFFDLCLRNLPRELEPAIPWADAHYRVVSHEHEFFQSAESPWLHEPLELSDDDTVESETLVKPIQTSGTCFGEIVIMRRILSGGGRIGYYWPTNDKAKDRWDNFTEKRFKACKPIRALLPTIYADRMIQFPNVTFGMAGVFTSGNLDSNTDELIVAEEVHQWEAGMLVKAEGRQTRVTFPKFYAISNGSLAGDQLHQKFNNGTQQHYEVKCAGCGGYHIMRTRWEDTHPELGGLRYDSDGCKRADGTFDYNKLIPTLRYQFPCGHVMPDDPRERRAAAKGGRYSAPFNTGALLKHRSHTYQAVCCHNIRWLDLVMEKHQALRMLKAGDDSDWRRYLQEREALFYDAEEHRPVQSTIEVDRSVRKDRSGMPNRAGRIAIADWQKGYKSKGELTHWWLLILDFDERCNRQVVFEGKVGSDTELLNEIDAHEVQRSATYIDCSYETENHNLMNFAYKEGLNAVNGIESRTKSWRHRVGLDAMRKPVFQWRYYSPEVAIGTALHTSLKYRMGYSNKGGERVAVYDPREPVMLYYHKQSLIEHHFFLRNMKANVLANNPNATPDEYLDLIIPGDVSPEFRKHMESWEERPAKNRITNDPTDRYRKVSEKAPDHLLMCLAYADMILDWQGLIGDQLARLGLKQPEAEAK